MRLTGKLTLDEEGRYIASASAFYRVLRSADEQQRRDRTAPPRQMGPPRHHLATGPNEVDTIHGVPLKYTDTLRQALFKYIGVENDRIRRYSSLGYMNSDPFAAKIVA